MKGLVKNFILVRNSRTRTKIYFLYGTIAYGDAVLEAAGGGVPGRVEDDDDVGGLRGVVGGRATRIASSRSSGILFRLPETVRVTCGTIIFGLRFTLSRSQMNFVACWA